MYCLDNCAGFNDVQEYGYDILRIFLESEDKYLPIPAIIESQTEITWKMRKMLILWIIEVHAQYSLIQETLFLTINIMDRIASKVNITRQQYQLVGIASLWIACKYEENHGRVPSLKNLCYISCNSFEEKDVLAMERMVLHHIHFNIGAPSCWTLLSAQTALLKKISLEIKYVASYVLELSLTHRRFVGQKPSFLAKASLVLAQEILGEKYWISNDKRLIICINQLSSILVEPPKQIFKKYCGSPFLNVAMIVKAWVDAAHFQGQHLQQYNKFGGLMTPPKESTNDLPVWDKLPTQLENEITTGVWNVVDEVQNHNLMQEVKRKSSCMW